MNLFFLDTFYTELFGFVYFLLSFYYSYFLSVFFIDCGLIIFVTYFYLWKVDVKD